MASPGLLSSMSGMTVDPNSKQPQQSSSKRTSNNAHSPRKSQPSLTSNTFGHHHPSSSNAHSNNNNNNVKNHRFKPLNMFRRMSTGTAASSMAVNHSGNADANAHHLRQTSQINGSDEYKELDQNNTANLVAGRWEIREKLGSGSFGEVRLALDVSKQSLMTSSTTTTDRNVAIKFEHKSDLKRHLQTEYNVYSAAKGKGFPKIHWFGTHGDYSVLVMELCGSSLKTLYSKCNRIFPVQTVALIAIQMLDRLEVLHNSGWLHQDIKPENIVIGAGEMSHTLYLIDYGTSSYYLDSDGKHRARAPSSKIVGTARYSSLNNHYGYLQSRRDDLESLGYTLIYWLLGRLPWQGIQSTDFRSKWKQVRRIKRNMSAEEVTKGLPVQFLIYLKYVFKLSFSSRPNYQYLKGLMRQLLTHPTHEASAQHSGISSNNYFDSSLDMNNYRFAWEKLGN